VIQVDGLVKVYRGGKRSVDGVSFQVAAGEVFAFLGPNGAGKSTTAKILTTLMAPTAGTARVAGHDVVRESRQVRERIGYVAQSTGIDYFMTGRENLTLIGHLYHLKGDALARRVDEMLAYFGLTEVADQMAASYSGGMQRKLDIATSLLHEPKVLFLDEPTLGLDAQSRIDLWDYVRKLNADLGVTVFLTTHYLDEADRLAHRVGIIDRGVLQAVGTPGELKDMLKGDSIAVAIEDEKARSRAHALIGAAPFAKEVLEEEEGVRVYVDNGGETVADLFAVLAKDGIRVKSVTLARPTLDDVFIKFTGRSMDKVEEKVRPWWAQWAGDNWDQQGGEEWKGNKWVDADGSPKDKEAFEAWTREQAAEEPDTAPETAPDAPRKASSGQDAGWAGNEWVNADGTPKDPEAFAAWAGGEAADGGETPKEEAVSEEKRDDEAPKGEAQPGGWAGNEWVNADGTPKDPEAMAKWLKETGASKGSK
jgi:ABC-2 type transport system ATP-binding protein